MARPDHAELNGAIRFRKWSVFRTEFGRLGDERAARPLQFAEFLDALDGKGPDFAVASRFVTRWKC